jgi:sulfatase maturation enzyme AslB (radical SAM superfamily)
LPFLTDRYYLNFYGGEPLLCFDLIQQAVSFINKKQNDFEKTAQYSLTTNGSLITEEIIQTLDEHKFLVEFSFDGYVQDIQRKNGSFDEAVSNIKKISEHPHIQLEVNSVFTPETVGLISGSMTFIMDLGVRNINLSLSMLQPWNNHSLERLREEMAKLGKILLAHYGKTREIPVLSFRDRNTKGFFYCAGGQDRMAVTSEEHVWGCDLFADYFRGKEKWPEYRDYFFGDLDNFAQNHKKVFPRISANYAKLSMDNFATPSMKCLFCPNLENCTVCPVAATFSGASIGEIPSFVCELKKIRIAERQKFQQEILAIS